jgi:hypothetical protein
VTAATVGVDSIEPIGNVVEVWDFFERGEGASNRVAALR